jgi:hypothetical protein
MKHQTFWKRRVMRGGLTGAVLLGLSISLVVLMGADTYPEMRVEDMDPFFVKHAILILFLFGAYSGAVLGGVTSNPQFPEL